MHYISVASFLSQRKARGTRMFGENTIGYLNTLCVWHLLVLRWTSCYAVVHMIHRSVGSVGFVSCNVANIYSNLHRTFGDGFLPSEMLLLDSEDTLLNMNPPVNPLCIY